MIFHLDLAQVLTVVVGTVLPLLTGLVTRWDAHPGTRAMVLLVLSVVAGFVGTWLAATNANETFDVGSALLTALVTFLVGVGTHYGFWRPTGTAAAAVRTGGFIGGGTRPPVSPTV